MKAEKETVLFNIEHTDTFAGEANYSWLHRYEIEAPGDISDLALVRRAKRAAGHNGVRCRRVEDEIKIIQNWFNIMACKFLQVAAKEGATL